jgi:hypothetical protein
MPPPVVGIPVAIKPAVGRLLSPAFAILSGVILTPPILASSLVTLSETSPEICPDNVGAPACFTPSAPNSFAPTFLINSGDKFLNPSCPITLPIVPSVPIRPSAVSPAARVAASPAATPEAACSCRPYLQFQLLVQLH